MAELTFGLEYEGPALAEHEMDARDFARSVLSAAELFQELNRVVYPADPELSVNIRAVAPGSFDILLKLFSESEGLLTSLTVTGVNNLAGLLNMFSSIIRFVRHRSRAEVVTQRESAPGLIDVGFADGSHLSIPSQALGLSESISIRRDIEEIVRPVDMEGIDSLTIRRERTVIERVDKTDVAALMRPPAVAVIQPTLTSSDRELWLQVRSVIFEGGTKWRFSDGASTFGAAIDDPDFLGQIDDDEAFRKGDRLHCILREGQWFNRRGELQIERRIIRVLDHVPRDTQLRFPDQT